MLILQNWGTLQQKDISVVGHKFSFKFTYLLGATVNDTRCKETKTESLAKNFLDILSFLSTDSSLFCPCTYLLVRCSTSHLGVEDQNWCLNSLLFHTVQTCFLVYNILAESEK